MLVTALNSPLTDERLPEFGSPTFLDWVITGKSVAEARAALAAATRILERLGVRLNPQKTRATAELVQELNRTLPTRPDFKTTCQSPGYLPL